MITALVNCQIVLNKRKPADYLFPHIDTKIHLYKLACVHMLSKQLKTLQHKASELYSFEI